MVKEKTTTIAIPITLAKQLAELKTHARQPYYEVIDKLLEERKIT